MKQLNMITYRFRAGLGADDLSNLTKKFAEVGQPPGVIVHHVRLDGSGGYMLQEQQRGRGGRLRERAEVSAFG